MGVPTRHVLQQGPVLAGLGRTVAGALLQRLSPGRRASTVQTPGPELTAIVAPRPSALVRDYVRHVGGDPDAYRDTLPPHLFPQWGFGLAARTLLGIPYPLLRVMNGGCRLEVNGPLPAGVPLHVRARLQGIDDDGRRAVIHQRIATGVDPVDEAVVGHLYAVVPLERGKRRGTKERPRVPEDAEQVERWRIGPRAGLDFAKLTGDFNPVHWVPAYARASGFKSTILHGFSTLARAFEGLRRRPDGGGALRTCDVKFTRPLAVPAEVGLYVDGAGGVFVGEQAGEPAFMTGSYTKDDQG